MHIKRVIATDLSLRTKRQIEPRWPALVAMLALAGLYAALPSSLLAGAPRWFVGAVVVALLVPLEITHRSGNHSLHQLLGYILNAFLTGGMIGSFSCFL